MSNKILGIYFIIVGVLFFMPFIPENKLVLNCVIIGLYGMTAGWWLLMGHPWDMWYWLAAMQITLVVTFGYLR